MNRGVIIDNPARENIDEVGGGKESFIPEFKRHMGMCKESKTNLNDVAMFAFNRAVLLVWMGTRDVMRDALFLKESIEFNIFSTPVRLNSENFPIKFAFNKSLKIEKRSIHIRFTFEKIYPCKLTIVINKAYIIIITSNRGGSRTPYISEN